MGLHMNSAKFAHIAERWQTASDTEVATFKQYAHSYYGVRGQFCASVYVYQSMIDIVIRDVDRQPLSLLTILRESGLRVAHTTWNSVEWQAVPVDFDSMELMQQLFCLDAPARIEVINDLECIDIAVYNCENDCVEQIVVDKKTGLRIS
jgi:hypothetical protein